MPFHFVGLEKSRDRANFDCEVDALNRYLKYQASQDVKKDVCSCFVAIDAQTDSLAGFYTLSGGGVPLQSFPEDIVKKLPKYPVVPIALIGRLAVDKAYKGKKLGSALLIDALTRVIDNPIKVHSLVVDAKDEKSSLFYQHFGFIPFKDTSLKLFLPIKTATNAREKSRS